MRSSTFPLPGLYGVQHRLTEGFTRSRESLEPPSNMGAITAMIEGGMSGRTGTRDLVVDLHGAMLEAQSRATYRAARSYRRFCAALRAIPADATRDLELAYGRTIPEAVWIAWGGAAALLATHPALWQRIGVADATGLLRAANHLAGQPARSSHGRWYRLPSQATQEERHAARDLARDLELALLRSVRLYAAQERRA